MMCRLVGNGYCHMVMEGLGPGGLGLAPLGVRLLRLDVDYVNDQRWLSVSLFYCEVGCMVCPLGRLDHVRRVRHMWDP